MDDSNIFKIWGIRKRLLLTSTVEIDLINIKKDSFCSTHFHHNKINKFVVLYGKVRIESEYGSLILTSGEEFEIRPPLVHRFYGVERFNEMIELAYVEKDKIQPNDIKRISQGGRIVNGKEMTLDELKKRGLLDLK